MCAAFAGHKLVVQPFKKGPDYIDPSWLSEAAGRPCRSLDPFFFSEDDSPSPEKLRRAFVQGAQGADVCLIEGNHGLYDSSLDDEGSGSTAAVARALRAPVILVVNTARMTRSIAAMVHGYQTFEPETNIAGVILNNVAQSRHEMKLREAVERFCRIPVVGALPRSADLSIPDRHLGLLPRAEAAGLIPAIENCRAAAEKFLDLDAILEIARSALDMPAEAGQAAGERVLPQTYTTEERITIGVLRDRAFSFYYPENLEALETAGARLVFLDALQEPHLPQIDALYIGGGFPEVFMAELEANHRLRYDIRAAAADGLPIYAECGGLMYLSRRIHWDGRSAEMVGVLPFEVEMTGRPQGHGYVLAEVVEAQEAGGPGSEPQGSSFLPPHTQLRGHEFHHSRLVNWEGQLPAAYRLLRGTGLGSQQDGLIYRNVLAAYTHLHAGGSPQWAPALVARARRFHFDNTGR
jgi:cobyrinic acid a,c-diamide synthase